MKSSACYHATKAAPEAHWASAFYKKVNTINSTSCINNSDGRTIISKGFFYLINQLFEKSFTIIGTIVFSQNVIMPWIVFVFERIFP